MYHIKRDGALFCQTKRNKSFIKARYNTISYKDAHKLRLMNGCCGVCKKVYFEKVSKELIVVETE